MVVKNVLRRGEGVPLKGDEEGQYTVQFVDEQDHFLQSYCASVRFGAGVQLNQRPLAEVWYQPLRFWFISGHPM